MVIHFSNAVNATRKALERLCPKCRRAQVVPLSQKLQTVPCEVCGTPIPPLPKNAS
jgi:ribosomal protein S27E